MQRTPRAKTLGLAQLEDVIIHLGEREILAIEAIVTALKCNQMIPHSSRDDDFVTEFAVFLVTPIQSVFIGFADGDGCIHG